MSLYLYLTLFPLLSPSADLQGDQAGGEEDGDTGSESSSGAGAVAAIAGDEVDSSGTENGGGVREAIVPLTPVSESSLVPLASGEELGSSGKETGGGAGKSIAPKVPLVETSISSPSPSSGPPASVEEPQEEGAEDGSKDGKAGKTIAPSPALAETPVSAPPAPSGPPAGVEEPQKEGGKDESEGGEETEVPQVQLRTAAEFYNLTGEAEVDYIALVKARAASMPSRLSQLFRKYPDILNDPLYRVLEEDTKIFGNYVTFQGVKTEKEMEGK